MHLQAWIGKLGALATLISRYREAMITAEAVEKANSLAHFIPDFCLHRSIQNHT
jgi:hypothetical protein